MDYKTIPNPDNIPAERRVFVFPVVPNVTAWCGHRFDIRHFPKTNCQHCWSFYFVNHQEWTREKGIVLTEWENGEQKLAEEIGRKAVKKLKQFFLLVAQAKKISDAMTDEQKDNLQNTEYDVVVSPTEHNLNPSLEQIESEDVNA